MANSEHGSVITPDPDGESARPSPGRRDNSPPGGRPRGSRRADKAGAPAGCLRPLRERPRARRGPRAGADADRAACAPVPCRAREAATATDRISASSSTAPRHDEPDKTAAHHGAMRDDMCGRAADVRTRRRSIRGGTRPRAAPAIARASRGEASDSAGSPRANRRVTIAIIGEAGAPHPAAARRARADRAASAAHSLPPRRRRAARPSRCPARRAARPARAVQLPSAMLPPPGLQPSRRCAPGPVIAARTASRSVAMRGATSVRPPVPKTCR